MSFQLRGKLGFTDSRATIDPIAYDPVTDEVSGDWHRFTRTMKGERAGLNGTYLLKWEDAAENARTLADSVDELADSRLWFDVGILPGLWEVLGYDSAEPPVKEGTLVVLLMEDGWNPDREPKSVYIGWLNSALYASNTEALTKGIEKTIEECGTVATRKSIEAYAIDTSTGTRRQLDVDSDAFNEPAPAIA